MKSAAIGTTAIALVLAGCSSGPAVEVGEKGDSGGASSTATEVWTGYLEGVVLKGASPSNVTSFVTTDQVVLAFQTRSGSSLTGTVVFGTGSPPPVDPKVLPPTFLDPAIIQGYAFPMRAGTVSDNRAQFVLDLSDQHQPWCGQQTPNLCDSPVTPEVDYYYTCGPCGYCDAVANPVCLICASTGECQCTESGCSLVPSGAYPFAFDLTFQGDVANGTVLGVNGTGSTAIPVTLRLSRAQ
jgi:hypothetical protein